jgi:hypothetical protein
MNIEDIIDSVDRIADDVSNWQEIHEHILINHEQAATEEEYVALISLHEKLMDVVEAQLSDNIELEKFKEIRRHDYNMLITRECTIGGSVCIETLYDLTQRELEAGRMEPAHDYINIAVDAMAKPHYSREQLIRQESKLKTLHRKSILPKKIPRIFRK